MTRDEINSLWTRIWIAVCLLVLYVFVANLAGCTSAQFSRVKAHAVEDGMAASGGAAMVLLPFPYGVVVGVPIILLAPALGESMRPPDPVTVVHTKTDKDGKTTTNVETFQPKNRGEAPPPPDTGFSLGRLFSDLTWAAAKWAAILGAVYFLLKVLGSARYRAMAWNGIKAMLLLKPIVALRSMLAAEGAIHSGEVPLVQPRKTQDIVLGSVLPTPPEGDT